MENSWGLALRGRIGHWGRCSWSSGGDRRIEGIIEENWGFTLWREPMLLVEGQLSCCRRLQHFGDASTMGRPPRTAATVEWSWLEPRRQKYACCRGQSWRRDASPEDGKWIPDIGHWIIHTVEMLCYFVQFVTVSWFFPLKLRKYLTCVRLFVCLCLLVYSSPEFKDWGFRKFWILKD